MAYDGPSNTSTIYVNDRVAAVCEGIAARPADMGQATHLFIGRSLTNTQYFNGQLGCFRVHNRALRYADRAQHYSVLARNIEYLILSAPYIHVHTARRRWRPTSV